MANLRILAYNVADLATATFTGVTEDSSYPISNLADPSRGKVARTTTAAAAREFRVSWSADVSVNCVALCRHNLSTAATWAVTLYSGTAWTGSLASVSSPNPFPSGYLGTNIATLTEENDTGMRGIKNSAAYFSSTYTTVQSLKVSITDTANADGYIEASRLFVGVTQSPTLNPAFGAAMQWTEDARQMRMDSGTLRTFSRIPRWRELTMEMRYFGVADRLIWSDLYQYAGLRKDFWFSLYPEDASAKELEGQGAFKFASMSAISHELPAHWLTAYTITEA